MVLESTHCNSLSEALWTPSLAAIYFVGCTCSLLSGVHRWPYLHAGFLSREPQQGDLPGVPTLCVRQHARWSVFRLRLGRMRHYSARPAHTHHSWVANREIQEDWSRPDFLLCHTVRSPRDTSADMTDVRVQGSGGFCSSSLLQVEGLLRRWHPSNCCNPMFVSPTYLP